MAPSQENFRETLHNSGERWRLCAYGEYPSAHFASNFSNSHSALVPMPRRQDTSTNGTLVNGTKVGKNKTHILSANDKVVLFVPPAGDTTVRPIAFTFTLNQTSAPQASAAPSQPPPLKKARTSATPAAADPLPSSSASVTAPSASSSTAPPSSSSSSSRPNDEDLAEKFEAQLTCPICAGIFYKPISATPCQHTFCSPCYSQWMKKSTDCPECRTRVEKVVRNHTIMALADTFLEQHPNLKRSADELKQLDAQNTITDESLRVQGSRRYDSDGEELSQSPSDVDSDDDDDGPMQRRGVPRCIGCAPGVAPVDGFRCPNAAAPHQFCTACARPFPDRTNNGGYPCAIRCELCKQVFCKLYTRRCEYLGTFQPLSEYRFIQIPRTLFGRNAFEISVLEQYLASKQISVQDVWTDLLRRLTAGTMRYTEDPFAADPPPAGVAAAGTPPPAASAPANAAAAAAAPPVIIPTSVVCLSCAQNRIFPSMITKYRTSIKADLPAQITSRPLCWYGLECRTAPNNNTHASKYDHICKNTANTRARGAGAAPGGPAPGGPAAAVP